MNKSWRSLKLITSLLIIIILGKIIYSPRLLAESVASEANTIKFIPPPPPPDRSAAGARGEAASRGCSNSEQSLMALVPSYQETINLNRQETIPVTKIWGLTTSEHPTFWFFVPYEQSTISSMEFVLKDESQQPSKTIYRKFLTKPQNPGIISISADTNTLPLEISRKKQNKMYHWFFKVRVKCNRQQPAILHFVEGWIERTDLTSDLGDHFEQLTSLEKVAFYAEKGIWHDAITNLAELNLTNPNDDNVNFLAEWKRLLQSVNLENLAKYPLIKCCKSSDLVQ